MRGLVPRRLVETAKLGRDLGDRADQQLSVQLTEERTDHQRDGHGKQPTPRDPLAAAGEQVFQK